MDMPRRRPLGLALSGKNRLAGRVAGRVGRRHAVEIRRSRVQAMRAFRHRRWLLDEVFVKINGEKHYLRRAVEHEGEVLESFVTKRRDKKAALKTLGTVGKHETGRWLNNRAENSHQPFRRRERAMLRFRRMRTEGPRSEFYKVRRIARLDPQPLQSGTYPHQPTEFQGTPHRRSHRVAPALRGLKDRESRAS
jgi:hypothetical protein